jgi:hypothetical protein
VRFLVYSYFRWQIEGSIDWRDVPLLTALSFGVKSVEADVWLVGKTLYVRSHAVVRIRVIGLSGWARIGSFDDRTNVRFAVYPATVVNYRGPKSEITIYCESD